MKKRAHYSASFKAQIVREILKEEKTISQIAAEHGIHPNQLRRWQEVALVGLPSLFSDQEAQATAAREAERQRKEQALSAEIGRLTTQVAWLKKKLETSMSREQRLALVEREHREVPLSVQAEVLGLNRSSLYYRPVAPTAEEIALKHRIEAIYTATPFYGVRRITAQVHRENWLVNHKAIARHMRGVGDCWDLPWSQPEPTRPSGRNLSLFAAGGDGELPRSCLGAGHHVYPPGAWLDVSGRGAGLVFPLYHQVGTESVAAPALCPRGVGWRLSPGPSSDLQ